MKDFVTTFVSVFTMSDNGKSSFFMLRTCLKFSQAAQKNVKRVFVLCASRIE